VCIIITIEMKLIDQLEEDLLALTPAERIVQLHEVSYFLQSLAGVIKVEQDIQDDSDIEDLVKQAMVIKEVMMADDKLPKGSNDNKK